MIRRKQNGIEVISDEYLHHSGAENVEPIRGAARTFFDVSGLWPYHEVNIHSSEYIQPVTWIITLISHDQPRRSFGEFDNGSLYKCFTYFDAREAYRDYEELLNLVGNKANASTQSLPPTAMPSDDTIRGGE